MNYLCKCMNKCWTVILSLNGVSALTCVQLYLLYIICFQMLVCCSNENLHVTNSYEEHHISDGVSYKRKTFTTAEKTIHTTRKIYPGARGRQ